MDDTTGLELLRRPKHKASLTASWLPIDRLSFSATMLYVGSQVDGDRSFSIQRLDTDPYFVVNLAGEYNLNKSVTLFARIDNLFDKRYESPTGFQRPGFGVFGGARVSWGPAPTPAQNSEEDNKTLRSEKETSK